MATKWNKFTKEQLQEFVSESRSYREVANKVGYAQDGGSGIKAIKEMINYYNFDISHFTGQGWNKDNFDYSRFKKGNKLKSDNMRDALTALRGYRCEICGISSWMNKEIILEVHHIDRDHYNSSLDNLQLLCPNCHSQTYYWRGRQREVNIVSGCGGTADAQVLKTCGEISCGCKSHYPDQ